MSGERGERERLHKLAGRFGHHYMHFKRLPLQCADQFRRLVSSDPARNAHRYSHGSIVIRVPE